MDQWGQPRLAVPWLPVLVEPWLAPVWPSQGPGADAIEARKRVSLIELMLPAGRASSTGRTSSTVASSAHTMPVAIAWRCAAATSSVD